MNFIFKVCLFFLLISILAGCAVKRGDELFQETKAGGSYFKGMIDNASFVGVDSPNNFEKDFPKSELILDGVVIFKNKYVTRTIADNVSNFSFDNSSLVFSRKNMLITGEQYCESIQLPDGVSMIKLSSGFIMTIRGGDINVYSIQNCGEMFSLKRKYRNIVFKFPYIIQYNEEKFIINKIGSRETFLSGGLNSKILQMHYYNGFVYFIDGRDRIIPLLLTTNTSGQGSGKFLKPLKIKNKFQTALFYKDNLFINSEERLQKYRLSQSNIVLENSLNFDNGSRADDIKDCRLVKENGVLCGDEIYLSDRDRFLTLGNADKVVVNDKNVIKLDDRLLTIIYTDRMRYVKEISLNKPEMSLCKGSGLYFFKDIDGNIKKVNSDSYTTEIVDSIPDNCSGSYSFDNGSYYSKAGEKIMTVAKTVNESSTHKMLLRKIGESYYYFFLNKQNAPGGGSD